MNYNKLYYFVKIADAGTISKAAEQLYMSQPSLSLHLKELEDTVGYQLFKRDRKKMCLTPDGSILYQWAKPFFEQEDLITEQIAQLHKNDSNTLLIGVIGAGFMFDFPAYVQAFKQSNPEVKLEHKRYIWKDLDTELQKKRLDVAFTIYTDGAETHDGFYEVTVLKEGYACIAAAKGHPLSELDSSDISVIRGYPVALMDKKQEPSVYDGTIQLCQKHSFYPNIIAEYPYIEPLLAQVNMNEAVTCTSTLAPLERYSQIKAIKLLPEQRMQLVMLSRKSSTNPALTGFVDYIKSLYV